MTVSTLLKMLDVTRNTSKTYIVNIFMDGYGRPLNAKVDNVRVHNGGLFITANGMHDKPGKKQEPAFTE